MKTTIELDERLLRRAKERAASHGRSLRSVFEEALATWLDEQEFNRPAPRLRDARFHGAGGTTPLVDLRDWDAVRDTVDDERWGDA
ncbi:MAG TPA: hypothetical protein VGD67_26270 [Pseudonocardiaceae bacterium]